MARQPVTASDDTVGTFFSQEPLVANESDLTSYSMNSFILLHIYIFFHYSNENNISDL